MDEPEDDPALAPPKPHRKFPTLAASALGLFAVAAIGTFFLLKPPGPRPIVEDTPKGRVLPPEPDPTPPPPSTPTPAPTPSPEITPNTTPSPEITPKPTPRPGRQHRGFTLAKNHCAPPLHWEHGLEKISTPSAETGDGVLVVRALPWGKVSVCGAPYGEAPVEIKVRAGTYLVRVERGSGSEDHRSGSAERSVVVGAGARVSVPVDFTKLK
jgi:hypothetical protein